MSKASACADTGPEGGMSGIEEAPGVVEAPDDALWAALAGTVRRTGASVGALCT
ncbi:hypothetical protein ACFYWX_31315 [Streptomyces sp. NPDC002888]|uniref:hypothetical protein n=1 Tax=Streptomyces sp. NPDC002888 TaxID=3364668 RepID=UPI0036ABB5E9